MAADALGGATETVLVKQTKSVMRCGMRSLDSTIGLVFAAFLLGFVGLTPKAMLTIGGIYLLILGWFWLLRHAPRAIAGFLSGFLGGGGRRRRW
jgi:hypothetical protein